MESVREYLETLAPITDEEWQMIAQRIRVTNIEANNYLLPEGRVCDFMGFVVTGIFRAYFIDSETGVEQSIYFYFAGMPISNFESFITKKSSLYNIQALTDAVVVTLNLEDREYLLSKSHNIERIVRKIIEQVYLSVKERLNDFTMLSAEERYLKLIERNPDIFQKLPLGYISEYINIAPQSLSRIRKKLSQHKAESK